MRLRLLWIVALFLATLLSLNAQSTEPSSLAKPSSTDTIAQDSMVQESTAPTPAKAAEPVRDSAKQDAENQTPADKRKLRVRLGGFSVGAGYSHFSGPLSYPYGYPYRPFGFYPGVWVGASFWYPVWSPYPYYGPGSFAHNNGRGELRLTAEPKVAEVYIDGGYAGTADKLKSLWLDPGAYDLTLSSAGREPFHQRVYVLSGKSLKITAKLSPDETREKP
ncbi:MAG: PEGA domain-containing protein [Terriglobales bacterium]